MNRHYLGEIDSNQQFDDSLENIQSNKENSSTNTTFTKENANENAKSIFYEIPNTPASLKKSRLNQNCKVREEIRKSLNNTVTLRKTIEQQRAKLQENRRDSNVTYIKEEKKLKSKEKICDVVYLKTIDNLLNTVIIELELGRINSKFVDDRKYVEIFLENVNKLTSHLHAKLKFNAGLKILKWWRNRLAIRNAKRSLDVLKNRRNAAITIQKNWRRQQAQMKYAKIIKDNLAKRKDAKKIEQNDLIQHFTRRQRSIQQVAKEQARIESLKQHNAIVIQRCWRNYQFKRILTGLIEKRRNEVLSMRDRSAVLIQRTWASYQFRKKMTEKIEKRKFENQSALVIQRNWKLYLMKKNLSRLVEERRNEIVIARNESAKLIQKNWKTYSLRKHVDQLIKQRLELEHRSASIIQKSWKKRQFKVNLNARAAERSALKTDACRRIQRAWRRYREAKWRQAELENRSALVIQSTWRKYQIKKRFKCEHDQQNGAASIIQRSWRSQVFRRRLVSQMKLNQVRREKKAALVIQQAWRCHLNRKQLKVQRLHSAATQIQKMWRGYMTRRENKDVSRIFERISEVNKLAITQVTVGEKTKVAIQKLLNYKYHGTALHLLQELEKTTNLSDESCIQLANVMIIEILLKVVRECNRSEPCLQIIKLAYSVILNIAKNDKALPILSSIPQLKESIIETLNKHFKRTGIFLKAMTLLYILLKYENFPSSPAMCIKIRRLLNKMSENNQFSTMKQTKDKIYQFDPRWAGKKSIRAQFYNTKQTIDAFYQIYG